MTPAAGPGTAPHACSLAAWDVPSPAPAGSALRVKVGVRCAAGCNLAGRRVEVRAESGAPVGSGTLGETPWRGTSALYWTAVELRAPEAQGVWLGTAGLAAAEAQPPHEGAPARFSFRVAAAPRHVATVRVVEEGTRAPLPAVEVRMGPYRAATDARGVARLALPAGAFEVGIRKNGFRAPPFRVTLDADRVLEVEAARAPRQAELNERLFAQYPWG